jgi:outer membrane lipoprotein-sorting protein
MKRFISIWLIVIFFGTAAFAAQDEGNNADLTQRIEKSEQAYAGLKDYSAIFYKSETSDGKPGEPEEIFIKFEKPFKIFMGWLSSAKKGLQVVYERGKHRGKLAIHRPGLALGLVPVIFLDQNSPWVRAGSGTYDIEDAGIGRFLEGFADAVRQGEKEGKLAVKSLGKHDENGIKGEKLEVTFPGSTKSDIYFAYRIIVIFEEGTGLPVGMTLYDWENQLIGTYEYRHLQLNTGHDEEFKKQIHRQLYKVYKSR